MKRLRVLYLLDTLEVGGAERSLLAIIPRVPHVDALVCHIYPGDRLRPEFEAAGVRVVSLNTRGKYAFGRATARVLHQVRAAKPDIIHAMLLRSEIVARVVSSVTGVPVIGSFVNDSYAPLAGRSAARRAKLRCCQVIDAYSARCVRHFISNSEAIKRANCARLRIPLQRVTVVHRGRVPGEYLSADAASVAQVNSEFRGHPRPWVLNVSRLLDRKGQRDLLRAFAIMRQTIPTARLLIAGEGPERPHLEALIRALGLDASVTLLGTRDDVAALLHLADVFVLPSYYEGHPGALTEAMFAGRPIVATDIEVHREVLANQDAARLVPPGDPVALARELAWMVTHADAAAALGRQAREIALARYDVAHVAARYHAVYEAVLAEAFSEPRWPSRLARRSSFH